MAAPASRSPDAPRRRRRLFWKYVVVIVVLVTTVLVASAGIELWFTYRENQDAITAVQREKAGAAAARIEAFIREIEHQMAWTTQRMLATGASAFEQRRIDFVRLQLQVPAITELMQIDPDGKEQLSISRLAMDVVGAGTDLSREPQFVDAVARRKACEGSSRCASIAYHGPVTFRKDSEPYMMVAMGQSGGGVTVAQVNLKFIWDVVTQIKIGKAGRAYVIDETGNLIAHPDISLVLQKTSLAGLPQVREALARGGPATPEARDVQGKRVLTAHAIIPGLRWAVFVEQPLEEALAPLQASIKRSLLLLVLGISLAIGASLLLARRMVRPIQALQIGAARIGGGELGHRLDVRTGDELETLARDFNRMTEHLQESYATLEQRVVERTRELTESLEQQTATGEILRVISSSPTDVQPVFDAIVGSAVRLCNGAFSALFQYDGEMINQVAEHNFTREGLEHVRRLYPTRPHRGLGSARAILERRVVHIPDIELDPDYGHPELTQAVGMRSGLYVPMMKEGEPVGVIMVARAQPGHFSDNQITLLNTFADQAVIAVENVRLFKELESRNSALTESLEQQTATAEILRVISSSPTDVQPVLDVVAANAARVCGASDVVIHRVEGDHMRTAAHFGTLTPAASGMARPITRASVVGRAILDRQTVQVVDMFADAAADEFPDGARLARTAGHRTILATPLLREGVAIGSILIRRVDVQPFTEKQLFLLKTFADQAVIAIENVRLFKELESRNAEVTEALEQQTATSEVLQVISRSTFDLEPVLNVLTENATRLSGASTGILFRFTGDRFLFEAGFGIAPAERAYLNERVLMLNRGTLTGRVGLERRTIQIEDILTDPEYTWREWHDVSGARTVLGVPMLREDTLLGVLAFWREEVRPFSDKQIDLVKTFADQAVIAIENVRLLTELQERTSQLQVASRHKDEFLANMSHELRTPLNAIIGFSEVMLERMFGDINEKQEEYLNDILSSGRHLLSLINDILDLSKIEAGKMELDLADFNLAAAIDNALTLVHERAARRALTLEQEVDPGIGDFRGDERKIKQALLNLLSNAIKFTPEGGRVTVRAVLKGDVVEISVTDTGVGIAPEDQEAVFEEFRQVGTDAARKHEGTGLGLALTRRFIELHGGNILLESVVDVGSTFTFALPVRR